MYKYTIYTVHNFILKINIYAKNTKPLLQISYPMFNSSNSTVQSPTNDRLIRYMLLHVNLMTTNLLICVPVLSPSVYLLTETIITLWTENN